MSHISIPKIIAHRGASADAPENTLAAFHLAWEQGADGIEGDFRVTADGRIVCIHDADTHRTCGVRRIVSATLLDDLRELDAGLWKGERWRGERIPVLEEVLAIVPKGKQVFLELKTGTEIVTPLADVLAGAPMDAGQITLMSFDGAVVRACKQRMPQFKCLWLTSYKQQDNGHWRPTVLGVIESIAQSLADGLGSENRPKIVDDDFVAQLRAARINEIHIWTVDEPIEAVHYRRLCVASLITNRPDSLRSKLSVPNYV
ncbi:MAG TPA: glycerophosphodiester phosphodiesterase [Lacipirellulaceae bacterium]|jgi:glycerophosphoryl diester phosphodiesterase